jgi:hypothetical protein
MINLLKEVGLLMTKEDYSLKRYLMSLELNISPRMEILLALI